MKPIEVRFTNLRSYRGVEPTVVNFSDKRLLGILGDTGAGKSSVIEAIVAALYSATTWDGKNVGALVADGAKDMRVELDFEAAGRHWSVTRVIKAKGAAIHSLVEVDTINRWDTARDVNEQIVKLVGLNYKQFLQAVVLPQGKFDTLLKASATERAKALESILGMEQLGEVREQAIVAADELRLPLDSLRLERGGMLTDPAAKAAELTLALESIEVRTAELATAVTAVGETGRVIEAEVQHQRRFGALADAVTETKLAEHVARICSLAEEDSRHQQLLAPLGEAVKDTKAIRDRLEADTRKAAAEGRDRTGINHAQRALDQLGVSLQGLDVQRNRISDTEAELENLRLAASQARSTLQAKVTAETEKVNAAEILEGSAAQARNQLDQATALLAAARETAAQAVGANQAHAALAEKLGPSAEAATTARGRAQGSDEVRAEAEAALGVAQRANAAAAAAHGLGAGDVCPVCTRKLPSGFSAPSSADLDAARKIVETARTKAGDADREARRLEGEHENLTRQIEATEIAVAKAESQAASATADLIEAVGPVDLASDDTILLSGVTDNARVAEEKARAAREQAGQATQARAEAAGIASGEATKVTNAEKTIATETQRLQSMSDRAQTELAALPALAAPAPPLSPDSLADAASRLADAAKNADQLETNTASAVSAHQGAVDAFNDAEVERHRHVGAAVPEVRASLVAAAAKTEAAATAAGTAMPPAGPAQDATVAELAEWASALPALTETAGDACRVRAETARAAAAVAETARNEALNAVGAPDVLQLN